MLASELGVVRCDPGAEIPVWVWKSPFYSITRTADELSIFCEAEAIPAAAAGAARGWRALCVAGQIPLELSGVLASLVMPMASRQISIFSISTHDTDYMLVPSDRLDDAVEVLRSAGHDIEF
ncbi:MAG: ACT domain-containing protein [Opitutales bacterium]|nr:ACT domain-containing protein [Opitutales bacterium]